MNFFSQLLEWALLPFFLLGRFIGYCNRSFRRRWLFSFLVMVLLLGVHLYQRLHRETGVYSAIAYSPSTGVYNSAADCSSLADADRLARSRCAEPDARVVAWAHNSWCALALGADKAYGIGWAHTQAEAERLALAHCREHTKTPCYVAIVTGSGKHEDPLPPDGIYAAVAYSPATGRDGSADNCKTLGEAEQTALKQCDASDARVVIWANRAWCALAVGEDKAFGFAWGRSRAEVESQAREHCRQYTKTPCRIAVAVSASPTEAGSVKE